MNMHAKIQSERESRLGALDLKDSVVFPNFISGCPVAPHSPDSTPLRAGPLRLRVCVIALSSHAPRFAPRPGGGCTRLWGL